MKLTNRLGLNRQPAPTPAAPPAPALLVRRSSLTPSERAHQELKLRIHRELLQRIDLGSLARLDLEQATADLRAAILQLIEDQTIPLSQRDRASLADEILHEVNGLGPIEPLMRDPDVADILVNTSRQVYVERLGKLELTSVIFRDDHHLMQIIDRIVSRVGRR